MKMTRNTFEVNILSMLSNAIIVAFLFLAIVPMSFGQDDKKKAEEQKKQEENAAKQANKLAKKQDKDERRYQKIRDFSQNLYDTDPEFKELVDFQYRLTRKAHTERAYVVNTRIPTMKLFRQEGEKLYFDETLYANPMAQDFVNRVGQSLIPRESSRLYAFKIIQNPVPDASALSTGTIYITTGYLSLIDNEAQLAYILGHEIAHIEKDHWLQDFLVLQGAEPFAKKNPLRVLWWGLKDVKDAFLDPTTILLDAKLKNISSSLDWQPFQEDEADRESLKYMFDRNYDVREIPKLYEKMRSVTSDPRSQTGFIANPQRMIARLSNFQALLPTFTKAGATVGAVDLSEKSATASKTGARGIARMLNEVMAPDIQRKLENSELMASSEEFQSTMALVKRDNGLRALQFDMFGLARSNLQDSLSIRSNDPFAYYYYGKALKLTARNASEMSAALQNLTLSINADKRQTIAEPYLFRAMLRLGERNPNEAASIANDLRKYVEIYQRENAGALPPNMEFVYDFMQDLEVLDYRASPANNTADAPRAVYGSQPPNGQTSSTPVSSPAAVATPAPAASPKKPVKKP
ncbi:MAG: M48 family metalloprotease [Pyrinomonadaceae bacterium]